MGSSNWNELADGLDANHASPGRVLAVGPTAGEPGPPGGGAYTYGMRSMGATPGAFGLHTNQAGFSPVTPAPPPDDVPISQSIRGVLKRAASSGVPGVSAALYVCLETASLNSRGYILGLSDGDPSFIVLRKGVLAEGVPSVPVGSLGVLRRSTEAVSIGEWAHLRLDAVLNTTGDVVLNVFRNDLSVNTIAAPVWEPVPGITRVIDDPLGANTGSQPLLGGGFLGFAARFAAAGQRVHFDRLECIRGV